MIGGSFVCPSWLHYYRESGLIEASDALSEVFFLLYGRGILAKTQYTNTTLPSASLGLFHGTPTVNHTPRF